MSKSTRKILTLIAEIGFLTILALLFVKILDFTQLKNSLTIIKPSTIAIILIFQLSIHIFGSLQWYIFLNQGNIKRHFLKILKARICGFAVSYITPSMYLGGEPIRANLLKERNDGVTYNTLFATVTLDKYVELLTKFPTTVVGLSFLIFFFNPQTMLIVISLILIVTITGFFIFLLFKLFHDDTFINKFFRKVIKPFFRIRPRTAVKILFTIKEFEKEVHTIIHDKRYFYLAAGIGTWIGLLEVLQTYYILSLLGTQNLIDAFIIFGGTILSAIFTLIPANLGGIEGVNLLLFSLLGIGIENGLTYTIIIRIGQLSFVALGLALLFLNRVLKQRSPAKSNK